MAGAVLVLPAAPESAAAQVQVEVEVGVVLEKQAKQDPWNVTVGESTEKAWSERTASERLSLLASICVKVCICVAALYLFIVSLGLMGTAFKVLGGPTAGKVFRNSEIFSNPLAGLALGVLATVLVQSSSTSTSIIITMTAAGLMSIRNAIPMIMGANIGTSVTNTIVSLAQVGNRDEYRRAFAGATVHDCFNILTVVIMLPVEAIFGVLQAIGKGIVDSAGISDDQEKGDKLVLIKKITKPLTSLIMQVDKKLVTKVAKETDPEELAKLLKTSIIVQKRTASPHLFLNTPMSDTAAGLILLIASLVLLSSCLIVLVKVLQTVFRGRAAIAMKRLLNLEFKGLPLVADSILIGFGIGITILMQSSSITTSTLTPLVGIGLVSLEKMLPFTIGANIGTTVTGILAALASSNIGIGMQVAMAHLFFNIFGTIIWFPLPFMRAVPISMAKVLGNLAADSPMFPIMYLFVMFGVVPGLLVLFSLGGEACFATLFVLLIVFVISAITIMTLRLKRPNVLPARLMRDPAWFPNSLRVCPREEVHTDMASGNADDVGKVDWWQGGMAWSLGWIAIILLVFVVPNNQWASIRYAKFDPRENVGIGPFSVCSKMYNEEAMFAVAPHVCSSQELAACSANVTTCDTYSDKPNTNAKYEAALLNCSSRSCDVGGWQSYCEAQGCGGLHGLQCSNSSEALQRNARVSYEYSNATGVAWSAGSTCRSVDTICDNHADLSRAGGLGFAGLAFAFVGQFALLTFVFLGKYPYLRHTLHVSVVSFTLAWCLLLAAWASWGVALDRQTRCLVMDQSGTGAVYASGTLGSITEGGSVGYHFLVFAWVLVTIVLGAEVHKVAIDYVADRKASATTLEESAKSRHDVTVDVIV